MKNNINTLIVGKSCHCFRCHKDYPKEEADHSVYCKERIAINKDGGAVACGMLSGGSCEFQPNKEKCDYKYCHSDSKNCIDDCSCKKNGHNPHIPTPSHSWEEELKKHTENKKHCFRCSSYVEELKCCLEKQWIRAFISKLLQEQKDASFLEGKQYIRDAFTNKWIEDAVKAERDRIRKMVEGKKKREHGDTVVPNSHGLIVDTLQEKKVYNQALDDIITDLEKENI